MGKPCFGGAIFKLKAKRTPSWVIEFVRAKLSRSECVRLQEGPRQTCVAFGTGTSAGPQVRTQPVEFLEFVELDLRQAHAFYESWQRTRAFKTNFRFWHATMEHRHQLSNFTSASLAKQESSA